MKIMIKTPKIRLNLYLPNFLIKSRLIAKAILSDDNKVQLINEEKSVDEIKKLLNGIYNELVKFKKEFGRFVLLDVMTEEAKVRIVI